MNVTVITPNGRSYYDWTIEQTSTFSGIPVQELRGVRRVVINYIEPGYSYIIQNDGQKVPR